MISTGTGASKDCLHARQQPVRLTATAKTLMVETRDVKLLADS